MFEFLSPVSLLGLFAAAIPLLIHLSRSRKVKTMRFSTTRFLTDQFLRSYRMSRLKEIGLLAARMALFALFAMALAQPLYLPKGTAVRSGGSRAAVFVLDDSASMSYVEDEDNVPLFDKARTGARAILDGLKSGDSASVVLASRRATGPEVVFPQLTTELADVRQVMDSLTVRELGTDLVQAVVRAEQLLQASRVDSKEVSVFSDLQEFGFDPPEATASISNVADILHFFVSVRPKEPINVGLTALQFTSTRPMVGVPFALRPHVRCQGSGITACDLELFIDGQKMGAQHLDGLQSDRWSVGRFFPTFDKGGWHHGYVQVKDDRFPADNRRYFAFDVLDSVNVLAVNGASSSVPRLDELLFLKLALSAGAASGTPFHIDITTPTALSDEQLRDKALVILANLSTLTAPIVEQLEAFVDRGGGLLIFVGDQVDATFYNQSLAGEARLHGGLLPGRLDVGHVSKVPPSKSEQVGNVLYEGVRDVDTNHPALSAFADEQGGLFAGVQFQSVWQVEPNDSAVLMRTSNGSPLLLEKSFGQGRVMFFASTCDRDWTNFLIRPAFLPWVYRVVGYLCQQRLTWGLLALRLAGVSSLLLALSHPTWTHETREVDHGRVAIVVDDSLSMSLAGPAGQSRFAAARNAVEALRTSLDVESSNRRVQIEVFDLRGGPIEKGDGKALLVLGGYHSFGADGLSKTPLADVLPVNFADKEPRQTEEPFALQLTERGLQHPSFEIVADRVKNAGLWNAAPVLLGAPLVKSAKPGAEVLAVNPNVQFDDQPAVMIATQRYGKGATMVVAPDTTWRWSRLPRVVGQEVIVRVTHQADEGQFSVPPIDGRSECRAPRVAFVAGAGGISDGRVGDRGGVGAARCGGHRAALGSRRAVRVGGVVVGLCCGVGVVVRGEALAGGSSRQPTFR